MITFGRITSNRHVELTLCTYPTVLRALPDFLTEQNKIFFSLTFFLCGKKDFFKVKGSDKWFYRPENISFDVCSQKHYTEVSLTMWKI